MMRQGFTLIELLIVVAIISILSMIAVPNFLEAQTRAKTTRVKADMRTMKVALEAYHVDFSDYPPDNGGQDVDCYFTWPRLTTPVAYITQIPLSPFDERRFPSCPRIFEYWRGWGSNFDPGTEAFQIWYRFTSVGPDQIPQYSGVQPSDHANRTAKFINALYDPSNGTISAGDLIATANEIY
ncbi:MAG: prepilin-type N-terminal cleavage/methylation domain-containing protein [Candidatus Sumerlaeota bacterium]|nr:prepilin-type N-terminal cleavage/methylation domain-containing protein [Candidatus Sumerlaeota bacterium]